MKKNILLLMILAISFNLSASLLQSDSIPRLTRQEYLRKSKIQLTGAIVSLSGGGLMAGYGGYLLFFGSRFAIVEPIFGGTNRISKNVMTYGSIFFLLGAAAITGSVFLFKASSKNKKRGLSITAGSQSMQQMNKSSISKTIIPSVGIKIRL
jgi:hypothetical protein